MKTLLRKIRMHCEKVTQGQLGCSVKVTRVILGCTLSKLHMNNLHRKNLDEL